ncbi:RNA polymerase-associated protein RapA [subsurface metagenome]
MNSRLAKPIVGCFVIVEDDSHLGIGKLVGLNETKASVEWFESVSNRHVQEYNPESLRRVFPSKQTRCYVSEDELSWKMGRIMGRDTSKGVTGIEYDIHWPKKQAAYVPEEKVFVRCDLPSNDPMETLIHRAHETAFFHDRRSAFLSSLVKQRAIGHGLTGLLSSRIRLYPYQIQIIHRVLEDPVQRYLLADEVGLGKTIEAGVILRQTWLDNQDSRALVIVPPTLELQWLSELEDKLGLDTDNGFITLVTTDQISQLGIKEKYDIVVIDEAQHVASSHRSDDTSLWDTCRVLAHDAPKLLLLSATPALHHEEDFLAILHLLEPQNYRLEDIDTFRVRVRNRQPIGRLIQRLHGDVHVAPLRRTLDRFRELFSKDELVLGQVKALEEHCNAEKFDQVKVRELIQDLMIHICETHRIYRRMLRTSRSSLPANTLCPRTINPGDVHVTKEWGFDERLESVLPLLEEWRATAVASVWKIEEGKRDAYIEKLTDVFIVLLQSSSNWLQLLAWAIKCRLSGVGKLAQYEQNLEPGIARILVNVPLFNGEENLLLSVFRQTRV